MTIPAEYQAFNDKGAFLPLDPAAFDALDPVESKLYAELREAMAAVVIAEQYQRDVTDELHKAVRDLRDAEHQRDLLPKLTQQDLLRAVLKSNGR